MKRNMLVAAVAVAFLGGTAQPANAVFHAVFDEFGAGLYELDSGIGTWYSLPFSITADPTGGVGGPVLMYHLPEIVGSGDVNFYEPGGSATLADWTDTFRFFEDAVGSHLIFYSDLDGGASSPADTGPPANFDFFAPWVEEYVDGSGTEWCIWDLGFPGDNRYDGISDYPVPEPATWAALGLGLAAIARKRRK